MHDQWDFKCFKDKNGDVIVILWLKPLGPKAWMSLKRNMENLACRPIIEWHKPQPASKIDTSDSIYVIRFKDKNSTQWRIYGFHEIPKYAFVMTNFGTERDGKYIPPADKCAKQSEAARKVCSSDWEKYVCNCIQRADGVGLRISDPCAG